MKNKHLIIMLLLAALGCSDNQVDEIDIRRNPLVEFSLDNKTWKASSFQLVNIGEVVVFDDSSNKDATTYQRLFFQIKGRNENGGARNLTIIFDLPLGDRLLGKASYIYSPLDGGIRSVEFSDQPEGKNSPFKLYMLAVDETEEVFIDTQHQSLQEKIVAGVFKLVLTDVTDSTNKIFLNQGVFKDIPYTEL
jgi:hypothetical protein